MLIRQAVPADIGRLFGYEHIGEAGLLRCVRDGLVYALVLDGEIKGVLRYSLFWQSLPFLELLFIGEDARGSGPRRGSHALLGRGNERAGL